MPKMQVPKKLLPILTKKKRFKVMIGGRGSGKSQTAIDACLADTQMKGLKIGYFREFMNSIDDSVYSLLVEEIDRMGLQGFDIQKNRIKYNNEDVAVFRGLSRNPESMKSMHGFKRFVVEEAQTISYKSLKMLTPTLRTDDSEIWFIGNPSSSADPFSQRFIVPYLDQLEKHGYYEDDLHLIVVCNYSDNPFFPEVLEQERQHDYLNLERAEYDHIWNGKFNDTVSNAIIKAEWFDAAVDAHKKLGFKPRGAIVVSHDPSDTGPDDKGIAVRHGSVFLDIKCKEDGDVNDGADWATGIARDYQADLFNWDCDGMGVSLNRQINDSLQGLKCETVQFKGSMGVDNPDDIYEQHDSIRQSKTNRETFKNKRSQYYWKLRDRFYKTYRAIEKGDYIDPSELISISSDIEHLQKLRSEVCRIPLKTNNTNGLIQIMSKDEMLTKYQIESPNMADSMMMAMAEPSPVREMKPLNYPKMSIA